jgi:hypothetical protein
VLALVVEAGLLTKDTSSVDMSSFPGLQMRSVKADVTLSWQGLRGIAFGVIFSFTGARRSAAKATLLLGE